MKVGYDIALSQESVCAVFNIYEVLLQDICRKPCREYCDFLRFEAMEIDQYYRERKDVLQ